MSDEMSGGGLGGSGYGSTQLNVPVAIGCSFLVNAVAPFIIREQNASVPSYRLLEKSPDFVETYSKTYIKTVQRQRFVWSGIGTLAGFGATTALIFSVEYGN